MSAPIQSLFEILDFFSTEKESYKVQRLSHVVVVVVMYSNVEKHYPFQEVLMKAKKNEEKSKKCNQCDYATSRAASLRTHLKTHSGEKSNKCNQCD